MYAEVYYNLHQKCLSVRAVGGRVIAHREAVEIKDAKFIVSKAGNKRVRREGRKNVHAVIRGDVTLIGYDFVFDGRGFVRVTYNPYLHRTFIRARSKKPVKGAGHVFVEGKRVLAKGLY